MNAFTSTGPQAHMLPDKKRLHLQHGPIDLVIEAYGLPGEIKMAYAQAVTAFENVLGDLSAELPLLRQPWLSQGVSPEGEIAQRMWRAAGCHGSHTFVTPMIAVAGAVADYMLEALVDKRKLSRAYVNNGGDIALYFGSDQAFEIGVCANPEIGRQASQVQVLKEHGIGGVVTSGWRGRSHSLGIADAVTVLAKDAASADVAATLIANAVDVVGSPKIKRLPAVELSPDSDLGDRLVTVDVEQLDPQDVQHALDCGCRVAASMIDCSKIEAVFLTLQGATCTISNQSASQNLEIPNIIASENRLEMTNA